MACNYWAEGRSIFFEILLARGSSPDSVATASRDVEAGLSDKNQVDSRCDGNYYSHSINSNLRCRVGKQ